MSDVETFRATIGEFLARGVAEKEMPSADRAQALQSRVDETEAVVRGTLASLMSDPVFEHLFAGIEDPVRHEHWTTISSSDGAPMAFEFGFGLDGDFPDPNHLVMQLEVWTGGSRRETPVNIGRAISSGASNDTAADTPEEVARRFVEEIAIGVGQAFSDPARGDDLRRSAGYEAGSRGPVR